MILFKYVLYFSTNNNKNNNSITSVFFNYLNHNKRIFVVSYLYKLNKVIIVLICITHTCFSEG